MKKNPVIAARVAETRKERYGNKYMSEEGYRSRIKTLKKWSAESNPASQKIRCVELDLTFDRIKDAAKHFGFVYSTFCAAIRDGNKYGGYTWERSGSIVKRRYHYHKDGTPNMKPIVCVETGEIYQSAKDLAPVLKVKKRTISDIVRYNRCKNGFHYKYIDKGEIENGDRVEKSQTNSGES